MAEDEGGFGYAPEGAADEESIEDEETLSPDELSDDDEA